MRKNDNSASHRPDRELKPLAQHQDTREWLSRRLLLMHGWTSAASGTKFPYAKLRG
jgi:hypothetical protein